MLRKILVILIAFSILIYTIAGLGLLAGIFARFFCVGFGNCS